MVDYREIIRLKSTKPEMSNTMIASSIGSSRNTVAEVWKLVLEKGLSWPLPSTITNRDLEQILYPERTHREGRLRPDYEYVYTELAKPNVTLTFLLSSAPSLNRTADMNGSGPRSTRASVTQSDRIRPNAYEVLI